MGTAQKLLPNPSLRYYNALISAFARGTAVAAAILLVAFSEKGPIRFETVGRSAGIHAALNHSPSPEKHQIETMPGGVALFDYDGDTKLDVYLVNGAAQPSLEKAGEQWHNRLYRNLGNWRFEDVTARAGVAGAGFQMGAAAADYDNDGDPDLFVAGVNRDILYRNRGDGTFEDVTRAAGLSDSGEKPWSIAAAWLDFDNDGRLDLFIVRYVRWDPATEPFCGDLLKRSFRTYCHPQHYDPLPNALYRNRGNGTFENVSDRAGVTSYAGKGMGIAIADYDEDGDIDVFVANDTVPNFLFRNDGKGRFTQAGTDAGVGYNDDGRALSSMGVDFRDVDDDGRPDLFVTALANETFPLFRNIGRGLFEDVTYPSLIGAATLALSGWGTGIYDFDNDGRKDIFVANGDVNDNTEIFSSRKSRQSCGVLWNKGGGKFQMRDVGAPAQHRGAAFGDLDGDGKIDAIITRLGEPPLILRNTGGSTNHWLMFKLRGGASNRDGIGAKIRVDGQSNHVTTSVGYASSADVRAHFGLGPQKTAGLVEVTWPSGRRQTLRDVNANQVLIINEP